MEVKQRAGWAQRKGRLPNQRNLAALRLVGASMFEPT
jgi:hypothetical protein